MDIERDIRDERLRELLRALPSEKPSAELNARIMERVRTTGSLKEKRSERNILAWTIALSALVFGVGVWALYTYIDWSFLSNLWPEPPVARPAPMRKPEAFDFGMFRALLPFAGIVLFLLLGDSLLRRHMFIRRQRQSHK